MKIVKVKDKRRYGVKAVTEVGSIEPSRADGTFQLADDKAKILVEGDDSFCYAEDYVEEGNKVIPVEEIKTKSKVDEFVDLDADELAELEEQRKAQEELSLQKNQLQPTSIVDQIEKATEDHLEAIQGEPVEALKEETTVEENDEIKQYRAVLSSKTKAELTELAKSFPGGEWRALTKEPLIEYLIGKTT